MVENDGINEPEEGIVLEYTTSTLIASFEPDTENRIDPCRKGDTTHLRVWGVNISAGNASDFKIHEQDSDSSK
jgi:hypothetical protein